MSVPGPEGCQLQLAGRGQRQQRIDVLAVTVRRVALAIAAGRRAVQLDVVAGAVDLGQFDPLAAKIGREAFDGVGVELVRLAGEGLANHQNGGIADVGDLAEPGGLAAGAGLRYSGHRSILRNRVDPGRGCYQHCAAHFISTPSFYANGDTKTRLVAMIFLKKS